VRFELGLEAGGMPFPSSGLAGAIGGRRLWELGLVMAKSVGRWHSEFGRLIGSGSDLGEDSCAASNDNFGVGKARVEKARSR
jgi:hypothetical protein